MKKLSAATPALLSPLHPRYNSGSACPLHHHYHPRHPDPSLSSHDGSPEPEDTRGGRHNSPELGESAPSRQVSEFASRTIPPGSTSAAFTALAALSTVRSVFIKNTDSFSLSRPANAEAWAAQHVGKEASSPCGHCVKRLGPFGGQPCIVVDGHLCGACAGMHAA